MSSFGVVDYIVFVSVLLVSICVGLFYALKTRLSSKETPDDYLMGDRKMPLLPVALSLLVSFQSAIVVLGCSSEMYMRGTTFWWHVIGMSMSALATCLLFVPVFCYLRLTSVYEYLETRFMSRTVRSVGAALYILVTLVYLSIALYAPAVALTSVSPFPLWLLILLAGSVCTAYVVMGGIKAVVWTDAIQAVFMFVALLVVAIKGTLYVGGFSYVWQSNKEGGRILAFEALLLNIPALFVVVSLICYCGLVMYSSFRYCDPLTAGIISDRDMLFPYFVMDLLGSVPGIPGLFIACLFSGTLSTVSSGLNSLSAVLWEDFIKIRYYSSPRDNSTTLTKCFCLLFGLLTTLLAFLSPVLGGVLQAALSTMGAINGPLTGIFLLGVLVPFANKKGAICGAIVSFTCLAWLCIGAHVTQPYAHYNLAVDTSACNVTNVTAHPLVHPTPQPSYISKYYSLSFVLYDMLGIFIVLIVAIPVSLLTGGWHQNVNPLLFHPIIRKFVRNTDNIKVGSKEKESVCLDEVSKPFIDNSCES